jgi:hypothetical protein
LGLEPNTEAYHNLWFKEAGFRQERDRHPIVYWSSPALPQLVLFHQPRGLPRGDSDGHQVQYPFCTVLWGPTTTGNLFAHSTLPAAQGSIRRRDGTTNHPTAPIHRLQMHRFPHRLRG